MNVRRTGDVAWRRIDRETVVIHLTRHRMFGLNETGGRLWEALAEPVGLEELTGAADPDPAVTAFLADLATEGLQRFAGQCAFFPGGGYYCDQQPFNS